MRAVGNKVGALTLYTHAQRGGCAESHRGVRWAAVVGRVFVEVVGVGEGGAELAVPQYQLIRNGGRALCP